MGLHHWIYPEGLIMDAYSLALLFSFTMCLLKVCRTGSSEDVVTFMDDMLMLACGKTLCEIESKVKLMMERDGGRLDWSHTHQCRFTIKKFGIMGFSRRREPNPLKIPLTMPACRHPIFLQGIKVPIIGELGDRFAILKYVGGIDPIKIGDRPVVLPDQCHAS